MRPSQLRRLDSPPDARNPADSPLSGGVDFKFVRNEGDDDMPAKEPKTIASLPAEVMHAILENCAVPGARRKSYLDLMTVCSAWCVRYWYRNGS